MEAIRQDPEKHASRKRNIRNNVVKVLYGITAEQRAALLDAQGGICKLCEKAIAFGEASFAKGAHLDHCHETGKIRGVLCGGCNTSLGKLGDTVEALERAVKYLKGEL